jgi:hypothetical protein
MLPCQRRDVADEVVGYRRSLVRELSEGLLEMARVPDRACERNGVLS